ncbi:MAG: hypothetical protein EXX96DRAFT_619503 [Benjaminiella poitrasii]|nr:MAG: hypothetical protein EXX96DRAFT_619503 [Benjaminiella poitrasii]
MPNSLHNVDKVETTDKVLVSKYTRPIEFIAESKQADDERNKKRSKVSNSTGDQVASFYRSIISPDKNNQSRQAIADNKVKEDETTWYCKSCEMTIPRVDYKRHVQGTAHLVSSADTSEPAPDILTLNGANVGFRMLQSQGWEYEQGLGATNQGRRHPIATVLKQDRFGVGHQSTGKKVVTHKYKEIEKRAIDRQRREAENQKDAGKEIAKKAKEESKKRVAILHYMKN